MNMFKIKRFENGIRMVYENIPYVKSVAFGLWIASGSRNERSENNGISHFIEHMLFKGTKDKTAQEIAAAIDGIGGQLNGFTGKECTCYYTRTLDEHLELAVEVIADMFFNSRMSKKDMEIERLVINEEINMYEDNPEDLVHDVLSSAIWKGNPLGFGILGTEENLEAFTRKDIKEYMKVHYNPSNIVIAVAGSFNENALFDLVGKYFGSWSSLFTEPSVYDVPDFKPVFSIKEKDTEQMHICIGLEGIEHGSDDIYPLLAINNVLGGGMSSRLFQKIREQKGLVYAIYSYPSSYKNAGIFTIYAGMKPDNVETVLKLISNEIQTLKDKGLEEEELVKSKEQLKGGFIIGLEGTSSRMNAIGKSELLLGHILTPDEVLEKVNNITIEDVKRVISRIFDLSKVGFAAIGKSKKDLDYKKYLLDQ